MNNQSKQSTTHNSASAALSLKLAGLFAVSFALFFILFFAYDLLSGFLERNATASQPNQETQQIVVDPKIADDLAKVLSSNNEPFSQEVKNPFFDRGGLSGASIAALASNTATASASKNGTTSAPNNVTVTSANPGKGTANSSPSVTLAVEGTKERYASWQSRSVTVGDTTLDPRVFAIEDLTPVGVVDGGSGQQEVMFYSQAAEKTVSFPVGTMFFDGWLTELRPEGVVFSSNDDRRIVRMRSWARSLKNLG